MIFDELNEFADATSVANAAGIYVLGDVIDLGKTTSYLGNTDAPIYAVVECTTQMITGGTASTIQFFLVSDSLATLGAATVASCTTHATSLAIVTDDATALGVGITAGTATYLPNQASTVNSTGARKPILLVQLPPGNYERYLGVLYTVGAQTVTVGAMNAFLTKNPKLYTSLPDAI